MALRTTKRVSVDGLRELDKALSELPKATARNVLKRTLVKAGTPIAEHAKRLAPVDTGKLKDSIKVSPRLGTTAGKAEFAAAMRAGLGQQAAVGAMRDARRAAKGAGSFAEVYIGPDRRPQGVLQEFGTSHHPPQPFMRPAWDAEQDRALDIIKSELGSEIMSAAKRLAARAAKKAAKG